MNKIFEWLFNDITLDLYKQKEFQKMIRFFILMFLIVYILIDILCVIMGWNTNLFSSLIGTGLTLTAGLLFHYRHIGTSIFVIFVSLFFSATYSLVVGAGLHDVAVSVYLIIIAMASLILKIRGYIIIYFLTIFTLVGIACLTYQGTIKVLTPEDIFGDMVVLIFIVTVFSIIMRILANNIKFYQKENVSKEIVIREKDREIQLSQEKIHYLYDHLQDIYFECDMDGKLRTVSPQIATILQYPPAKLYYRPVKNLLAQPRQLREMLRILVISGKVTNFELNILARDNTRHTMLINASYIRSSRDKQIIAGTAEDISDKKEFNEKIQQLQKLDSLGKMAGTMAHDFNNLITVIGVNTEILIKKLSTHASSDYHENLETIMEATKKAAGITRQVLDFSRSREVQLASMDINTIVNDFLLFSRDILPHEIKVEAQLQSGLPFIRADKNQMEQVLMNLIINARDAILEKENRNKNDKIVICTKNTHIMANMPLTHLNLAKGEYIILSVKDSGIGIDAEKTRHIFEPFYSTKGSGGTGLGLSSVYGIVRQHGGDIMVDSHPGQGTTFQIYWPVIRD